jgi:hypothetical protein
MPTRKVTISLDADEMAWIEQRARRLHGGNVSAAFVDGLRALRRREALQDFLKMSGASRLTPEQLTEALTEIRGARPKSRRARRAA